MVHLRGYTYLASINDMRVYQNPSDTQLPLRKTVIYTGMSKCSSMQSGIYGTPGNCVAWSGIWIHTFPYNWIYIFHSLQFVPPIFHCVVYNVYLGSGVRSQVLRVYIKTPIDREGRDMGILQLYSC